MRHPGTTRGPTYPNDGDLSAPSDVNSYYTRKGTDTGRKAEERKAVNFRPAEIDKGLKQLPKLDIKAAREMT